jgi:hypothetical protein
MRSIPHWIKVSFITLLAIGVALYAFLYLGKIVIAYRKDYRTVPPNQIFQMVFEKPVTSGVTISRASGRHYAIKFWVWMRLEATPESIDPFLKQFVADHPDKLSPLDAYQRIRRENMADKYYLATDHKRVGWDAVYDKCDRKPTTSVVG